MGGKQSRGPYGEHGGDGPLGTQGEVFISQGSTQGEVNPPREPLGGGRGTQLGALPELVALGSAGEGSTPPGVNAQESGSGASQITGMPPGLGGHDGFRSFSWGASPVAVFGSSDPISFPQKGPGNEHGGDGSLGNQGEAFIFEGTNQGEVNPPREPLGAGRGTLLSALPVPVALGSAVEGTTPAGIDAHASGFGGHAVFGSFSLGASPGASSAGTAQGFRRRSNQRRGHPIAVNGNVHRQQAVFASGNPEKAVINISPRTEDADQLERILHRRQTPADLPFALLQSITNDFSEQRIIGQGGFGVVYKGVKRINENRVLYTVAVKRIQINENTKDDKSFLTEVTSLMKTDHRNVVRFLGFCFNTHGVLEHAGSEEMNLVNERLICLEYISNGSLDMKITDELRGFEWETRYKIIIGICEGLCYLHDNKGIIHMDLKPGNILLDGENMVPKITDFGMSRPTKNTHTKAQPMGTSGYIAPEYMAESTTTIAGDIYSLGAIISELVTGGMDIPKYDVLRRWRHRNKPPTPVQCQQITRCIEIVGRCRKQKPEERPSIKEIMGLLTVSTDGQTGQESTYLDDDMLRIDPLDLHYTFEDRKVMSWSVKLTNNTKEWFAFKIEYPTEKYTIQPDNGTLTLECKECHVRITVRASQVAKNGDRFIVQSEKVSKGLRVTEHKFSAESDKVDLIVVYDAVEAVSAKAIACSSYEDDARRKPDRLNFHPSEFFSHSQATNKTYLVIDKDRAIDVTRGAMGSLLHKLGVLHKEFNLETSVKEDINSLSKELIEMQPILCKVSQVHQDNLSDMVKRWVINAREMSYDLEDFLDGFLVHNEPGCSLQELTHEMCFPLDEGKSHHTIPDLIKEKRKQVQGVAEECKKYEVGNIVPNTSDNDAIHDLRKLAILKDTEELIGIGMQRDKIISLLNEGDDVSRQNLKILPIVGLGGLGKTTLANAVYEELKGQYQTRAFVTVGRNPDIIEVFKNIISQIEKDSKPQNMDVHKLTRELKELLKNKRYFIVIDDLWDSEASLLDFIKCALPKNNHGSRVITTTRYHDVAIACCNPGSIYVHMIERLGKEDSKKLFYRQAFGPGRDCPDTLKATSDDILKKCDGMPLAINSIARRLVGKLEQTWEYVRKRLDAITEVDGLETMTQILDLSYIHLPDYLKTCLLYVCKYPEDREIDKNDLLRQWVAEGFIHVSANNKLDAEDEAEDYFQKLINVCMIQPVKIDYNEEVLSCRVHDIILDLIRSKSSQVNFLQVIDGLKDEIGARGEIRRATVQNNDKEDSRILETIKGSLSHARSVSLHRRFLLPDFLKYKYVRVVHLEDDVYSHKPLDLAGISSLFFLRYLKIALHKYTEGELKLPDQIGHLQQLETIDLQGGELKNCPSDIVTLPRLMHLRYDAYLRYMIALPDGIDRLKSLRTLEGVCVAQCSIETIKGLGELTNLRNLKISSSHTCVLEKVEKSTRMNALYSSISRLSTSLRIFTVDYYVQLDSSWSKTLFPKGSHIRKLHLSGCRFQRCPEWIGQLRELYSLRIDVTEVADGVSIVAKLPSLAYFHFVVGKDEKEEKEERVVISGHEGAFKALKHLIIWCRKGSLTFEEGAVPKLEYLYMILRFPMIRRFLLVGLQHLPAPTLKRILLTVSTESGDWKVKGSEHWQSEDWEFYFESAHFEGKMRERQRKPVSILKRAFKQHHPSAELDIEFEDGDYFDEEDPSSVDAEEDNQEDGDEEPDEDAYDDEDFCMEDYYSSEEDYEYVDDEEDDESVDDGETDEGAYQENGSQTSAHVPLTCLSNLAVCSSPDTAGPVANLPVDINNDHLVEQGNNGMRVNSVGPNLDLSQAPPCGLVGIAASAAAAQPQAEAVDNDPSGDIFWDSLVMYCDEGPEDNGDDNTSQDAFWDNLLMDSDDKAETAVGQA